MHKLIEARIAKLQEMADHMGDYVSWYEGYADGDEPEGGIYVANWNGNWWSRFKRPSPAKVLGALLEEFMPEAELDWEDTTIACGDCYRLIRTESYEGPQYHMWDGDVSCSECIMNEHPASYIDDCSERGLTMEFDVDLEEEGWTRCESNLSDDSFYYDRNKREQEAKERATHVKNGYRSVIDADGYLWIIR